MLKKFKKMKIDISNIDKEEFGIKKGLIAGEEVILITPKNISTKWNKFNLIFRSSVWNLEGELISASFKKFFNWEEKSELVNIPVSMTAKGGVKIIEKIDGSTLIVSKYKNDLIVRTRGTLNAELMENGSEIKLLKQRYPKVFDNFLINDGSYSLIFEWVSPANRIVLSYPEPDIFLTGAIKHENYSLVTQCDLDLYAKSFCVKRPQCFTFDSIENTIKVVEAFKGLEGVCAYFNYDQDIRKIKSAEYLAKHRLKNELSSFERLVDFYFEKDEPSFTDAQKIISEFTDWETVQEISGDLSKICDAMKNVNKIIEGMKIFVNKISNFSTRKEQALSIIQAYGKTNRSNMVFAILDGKELDLNQKKRLLYQSI